MTPLKNGNKSYIKNITFDEKENNEIYEAKKAKTFHIAKIALKEKAKLI